MLSAINNLPMRGGVCNPAPSVWRCHLLARRGL